MSHLDTERLAMLADDEPTVAEHEHLIECEYCAREWRGYMALRGMAAQAPSEMAMAPLTTWDALASQLREEGLLRMDGARSGGRWMRGWMRIAAAVLLLAGGAVVGRLSVQDGVPGSTASEPSTPRPSGDLELVTGASSEFASVEDARVVLERAEQQYRLAALWLLEHQDAEGSDSSPELYRTRLAALDQMAGAAREAVYEAPHDPVINSYYLNTLAAREVTLKQLNASLNDQVHRF